VVKAGAWYLVFARSNGALDVQQVSNLTDVRISEESFVRDSNFDLAAFWMDWCFNYENLLRIFTVHARVASNIIPELPRYFGNSVLAEIAQANTANKDGWVTLDLAFESFEAARTRILSFGRGVEVLAPEALRLSVVDYAEQILRVYK
jgi:predicted DNA-binding transcriptional regulator YafY